MTKPRDAVGESIASGSLFRLIPNWSSHWDYDRGLPEPRSFRKDGDIGVSMLVKERITIPRIFEIQPAIREFGVCEFSIEELLVEDGVWVKVDDDEDFGDAHVLVIGITKRLVDWLRELAIKRIVKKPGPAKPALREQDRPEQR